MRTIRTPATLAWVAVMFLAACSGSAEDQGQSREDGDNLVSGDVMTVNSGEAQAGEGTLALGTDRDIVNWNVLSAEGNTRETEYIARMTLPQVFIPQPDWSMALNEDLLVSAEVTAEDPQTIVYTLQDDAVWSDGTPITGDDFVYTWQTQNGVDCPDCLVNAVGGYAFVDDIATDESGKVITMTFSTPYANWQNLFQFILPAHLAAANGDMASSFNEFFGLEVPNWSGGPFIVDEYDAGNRVTLVPNEQWYGTPANLESISLRFITDTAQQPTALQNDEIQMINTTPTVDLIDQIKGMAERGVVYQSNPGNRWPWASINLRREHFADPAVRQAVFIAMDVEDMIAKTVGLYTDDVERKGSLVHLPQEEAYVDTVAELDLGYGSGDAERASGILEDAGYTISDGVLVGPDGEPFPALEFVTYQTPIYEDITQVAITHLQEIGIKATLRSDPNPIPELLQPGHYDISLTVWAATPFAASKAQEVWTSSANFAGYEDSETDAVLQRAVSTADPAASEAALREADERLLSAAWAAPLFQLPTLLTYYDRYVNVRDNPSLVLGPVYNAAEWGLR